MNISDIALQLVGPEASTTFITLTCLKHLEKKKFIYREIGIEQLSSTLVKLFFFQKYSDSLIFNDRPTVMPSINAINTLFTNTVKLARVLGIRFPKKSQGYTSRIDSLVDSRDVEICTREVSKHINELIPSLEKSIEEVKELYPIFTLKAFLEQVKQFESVFCFMGILLHSRFLYLFILATPKERRAFISELFHIRIYDYSGRYKDIYEELRNAYLDPRKDLDPLIQLSSIQNRDKNRWILTRATRLYGNHRRFVIRMRLAVAGALKRGAPIARLGSDLMERVFAFYS